MAVWRLLLLLLLPLIIRQSYLLRTVRRPTSFLRCIVNFCPCFAPFLVLRNFQFTIILPGESSGKLPPRTCPGCSVPEPYQSHDWALVPANPRPLRLNANEWMNEWILSVCSTFVTVCTAKLQHYKALYFFFNQKFICVFPEFRTINTDYPAPSPPSRT